LLGNVDMRDVRVLLCPTHAIFVAVLALGCSSSGMSNGRTGGMGGASGVNGVSGTGGMGGASGVSGASGTGGWASEVNCPNGFVYALGSGPCSAEGSVTFMSAQNTGLCSLGERLPDCSGVCRCINHQLNCACEPSCENRVPGPAPVAVPGVSCSCDQYGVPVCSASALDAAVDGNGFDSGDASDGIDAGDAFH
jgi:hypothetical protein